MAEITLQADTGRTTGSRASGRLRGEGKVPGVVYGLGKEPQSVAVVWRDLRHALTGEAGLNALIDLHVDGAGGDLVIVKEMQRHPVRRDVLHVDFLRVSRDQAITVEVPVVLHGDAQEVTSNDGQVDHILYQLAISAKPADIPNEIPVDISALKIGDAIRVGDLVLPEGVTTDVDPEDAVVTASVAQVADLGEVEEAEEAAEGEEAAGEAGEAAEAPADEAPSGDAE
jgi:large subunit ribosomal protein L25